MNYEFEAATVLLFIWFNATINIDQYLMRRRIISAYIGNTMILSSVQQNLSAKRQRSLMVLL
jgi:hypothetical protein